MQILGSRLTIANQIRSLGENTQGVFFITSVARSDPHPRRLAGAPPHAGRLRGNPVPHPAGPASGAWAAPTPARSVPGWPEAPPQLHAAGRARAARRTAVPRSPPPVLSRRSPPHPSSPRIPCTAKVSALLPARASLSESPEAKLWSHGQPDYLLCACEGHVGGCHWPGSPRTILPWATRPDWWRPHRGAVVFLCICINLGHRNFSARRRELPKRSVPSNCKCNRFSSKRIMALAYSHHMALIIVNRTRKSSC